VVLAGTQFCASALEWVENSQLAEGVGQDFCPLGRRVLPVGSIPGFMALELKR
jgi:hypothetical protein